MPTLLALMLLTLLRPSAPPGDTLSKRSYAQGRRILDAAVAAHGGAAGLRAARRFTVVQTGLRYQLFQNADPEQPFDGWSLDRTAAVDLDRGRAYGEYRVGKPGSDYVWWTREYVDGESGWELIMTKKWAVPMIGPSIEGMRDFLRLLPQSLLVEALEAAPTLRALGSDRDRVDGREHEVVGFTAENGQRVDLSFDRETKLLTRYETLTTRNTVGDTVTEFRYGGYHDQNGIPVPRTLLQHSAGFLATDARYTELRLDTAPPDSHFSVPGDFTKLEVYAGKPEILRLSGGVFLVRDLPGGYNSLVVELPDSILVVEACETNTWSGIGEQAAALAKKAIPGKPIRWIVLTHHHGDHSAGVRAYMAQGATVVTTAGNRAYVERVAAAPYRMRPDAFARSGKKAVIEILQGRKRVIGDASRSVELYEIGPNSHCREMLVAYLPKEKILFQSDMFNPVVPGGPQPIEHDAPFHGVYVQSPAELLRSIRTLGLDVRTIAGSHGRVGTIDELEEAARAASSAP